MFGGNKDGTVKSECFFYNGTWHPTIKMKLKRTGHTALLFGEKIVLIGGEGEAGFLSFSTIFGKLNF